MSFNLKAFISCALSALFFFYIITQLNLYNALGEQIMHLYQLKPVSFGLVSSVYFYTAALGLIPAGILLDHYRSKWILLTLLVLSAIATAQSAFFMNQSNLILYRGVSGLCNAFAFLICMRQVVSFYERKAGFAIGMCITIAMCGGIAQSPVILLFNTLGWRDLMLANAGFGIILLLLSLCFFRDQPTRFDDRDLLSSLIHKFKTVLKTTQNWICGMTTALLNLAVATLAAAWGSEFLIHAQGLSNLHAALVSSMIYLGMIISSPMVGALSDNVKHKRRHMMLAGSIISIAVTLILAINSTHSLPALLTLFFILGIATTTQIISFPIASEANPIENNSTAMALISVLMYLIAALSEDIFGAMIKLHHIISNQTNTGSDYRFAMLGLLVCFIGAAVFSWKVRSQTR